jgi:phosphoserine aminotransferase
MSGGGTGQFAAVPLNLFPSSSCTYVVSGTWSKAASVEASKFASVTEVSDWQHFAGCGSRFVYACTNETVNGVFFDPVHLLKDDQVLIADMSSEILTRSLDVSKYGLIFAGAQKNIGIAGVTVVIVREDLIAAHPSKQCPVVFDYTVTAKNGSL